MEEAQGQAVMEIVTLETTCHRSDDILQRKEEPIYPYENGIAKYWNLKTVSLFLNCLNKFLPSERSRLVKETREPYITLKFLHTENFKFYIRQKH
jgi:hypothetical protein